MKILIKAILILIVSISSHSYAVASQTANEVIEKTQKSEAPLYSERASSEDLAQEFLNEVGLTEGDNDGLFVAVGTAVLPEPDPASNPDFLTMRRIKASEASLEAKRQFIEFIRTTMSAEDIITLPESPFSTEFDNKMKATQDKINKAFRNYKLALRKANKAEADKFNRIDFSMLAKEGITATDLVLTIVEMLRKKGVVGKFVEFYGEGLKNLTLADRATIANMAPEYGATCGFFPVDDESLKYLKLSGRDSATIALVEKYSKEQGLWASNDVEFTDTVSLDVSTVVTSISGPKRPQDKVLLTEAASSFAKVYKENAKRSKVVESDVAGADFKLKDGDIVIAAITSCTNTSNPSVLIGAGLLAKKAYEKGLKVKPWVKTSLAPGSQVVTDYLEKAGLNKYLDELGFNLVGYGCTTCIGNSGPLNKNISDAINEKDLYAVSVLSGNRNFEGRINPDVKANYLASPPLVVAYALAGNMNFDLYKSSLGKDKAGKDVFLKDIWPSNKEIEDIMLTSLNADMFKKRYSNVSEGPKEWREIDTVDSDIYNWEQNSTYVKRPPFFDNLPDKPEGFKAINDARILLLLGDTVTTDHISPAGSIKKDSPTGDYFMEHQIQQKDFNSYGARRGNHEVMMRGTFGNIKIRNEMAPGTEGGFTTLQPDGKVMSVYEAAMEYKKRNNDLVVIAGKEYGTGSSRDWAAKGTKLLGIKAVLAESFERIHRSNLVGMGVLPLQFKEGFDRKKLKITGAELITIIDIEKGIKPRAEVACEIKYKDGTIKKIQALSRIDTENEIEYYKNGGILQYVLRNMLN